MDEEAEIGMSAPTSAWWRLNRTGHAQSGTCRFWPPSRLRPEGVGAWQQVRRQPLAWL